MRRRGQDSGKRAKPRHIMQWHTTYAAISVTAAQLAEGPYVSMRNMLMEQCERLQAERLAKEEQRLFDLHRAFATYAPQRPTRIIVGDLS